MTDTRLDQQQAEALHQRETVQGRLVMWTVTWNTSDYPLQAAARPNLIGPGTVVAMPMVLLAESLNELRQHLPQGLTPMDRDPNDDPVIVEIWL